MTGPSALWPASIVARSGCVLLTTVVSTVKARQFGFTECLDSDTMWTAQLSALQNLGRAISELAAAHDIHPQLAENIAEIASMIGSAAMLPSIYGDKIAAAAAAMRGR